MQVETNNVLHELGVKDRHLVAGFETACSKWSRFERGGSVIPSANRQKPRQTSETFSTCFWDPNAPLGIIVTWVSSQEPPQKWFSFRKCDERGWKSTLSNFETERNIVEYFVAVILRPQLTLQHLYFLSNNNFREPSLLSQNSNSGASDVHWPYILLWFIK